MKEKEKEKFCDIFKMAIEMREIRKRARALEIPLGKISSFPPLVNRLVNEVAENIVPQLE